MYGMGGELVDSVFFFFYSFLLATWESAPSTKATENNPTRERNI